VLFGHLLGCDLLHSSFFPLWAPPWLLHSQLLPEAQRQADGVPALWVSSAGASETGCSSSQEGGRPPPQDGAALGAAPVLFLAAINS
jgi:hypothetical protein